MPSAIFVSLCLISSSLQYVSSSSPSICPHQSTLFLNTLQSRCSLPNSPLQVGGDFLDKTFNSMWGNAYTCVLFYAAWCPFSRDAHSTFEVLSSMFPEVEHLAIEQSSTMPSIFSRYGIHSLPTVLMMNKTSRTRFRGAKNLHSFVKFYKKTTGLEPVRYVALEQPVCWETSGNFIMKSWIGSLPNEIITREPYLVLSVFFLCLMGFGFVLPKMLLCLKAFWMVYRPHLNLEIFGETSQILGRVVQMIDVERVWTKLRILKVRNFHQSTKKARVWASSLASVSLGETSCSRSSL